MATILIKRGSQADLDTLTLKYGELALAYSADKSKVELYAGSGSGKVLINPDVTADMSNVLNDAKSYTDDSIQGLINGAPEAMDTLKELADAIADNADVIDALNSAIANIDGGTF